MNRRDALKKLRNLGIMIGAGTIVAGAYTISDNFDMPGFLGTDSARDKSGISVLLAGLIGKKMYDSSNINLELKRSIWPTSKITGYTTPQKIHTYLKLGTTSASFIGKSNENEMIVGEVNKSEFDWKIIQTKKNKYKIQTFTFNFLKRKYASVDPLELKIENGIINGEYIRTGSRGNWDIKGRYDLDTGIVKVSIDGTFTIKTYLIGYITPQ